MLVLTRKQNESIQIDDTIEIKVLGLEGDQVKLGIDAPESVSINRKEVYLDIQTQNNEAVSLPADILDILQQEDE